MTVHDLRNRRLNYDSATLADGQASDPFELFARWMDDATHAQDAGSLFEATAMTLATAHPGPDGNWQPETRVVLLKAWDPTGFLFFTNYDSAKGREVDANPRGCLHFHWPELHRQVRIDGPVRRSSAAVSEEYFSMRPRGSQIGAWASRQSQPIASRQELEARVAEAEARFEGAEVPRPPFWGGLVVAPEKIEFWQGRPSRLHDRIQFTSVARGWESVRLAP
ncbi:pyridoxamine 5'-phosphate oxidase [Tessaracoccus sp. OS52]|uniref:pyridoxamine 5'-phosphate oxidase n=1 Tax=Tessaracoccus sp. OS52 TaxID=2886691 RepID=UPI001D1255F5|nr:pyridoxamine 5'-phosphate oxidase [Tessaracoccus sp. OS52]MCC2592675.1 pyridoxamine 5'-phosphate oxidase [Tessaracoccus sp. OS52]